ncbi:MAG: iron chaperone, partial [Steroidobacteraceae bacterium]
AKAIPKAQEKISYRIPAFALDGDVIYFAAFKKHIGVYPPVRDAKLKKEVARYAGLKGNLQFPLAEPIPYPLIGRIAKTRAKENAARVRAGRKKK